MDAAEAYMSWNPYVTRRVTHAWRKWGRDNRVELDDLVAEAWCRILRYWNSVQQARNPRVICGELASQAVTAVMIKIAGRNVMARGKMRRWGEKPPVLPFSHIKPPFTPKALRRSGVSSPLLRAIIREEVTLHPELQGNWFLAIDDFTNPTQPTSMGLCPQKNERGEPQHECEIGGGRSEALCSVATPAAKASTASLNGNVTPPERAKRAPIVLSPGFAALRTLTCAPQCTYTQFQSKIPSGNGNLPPLIDGGGAAATRRRHPSHAERQPRARGRSLPPPLTPGLASIPSAERDINADGM